MRSVCRQAVARTSIRRRPRRSAVSRSASMSRSRACMPLMMSRPASIACTSAASHAGGMKPPALATPITIALRAGGRACAGVRNGRPVRDRRAGAGDTRRRSARGPVAQAEGGLRVAGLGGVAEEQQVGLRQTRRRTSRDSSQVRQRSQGAGVQPPRRAVRRIRSGSRPRGRTCAAGSASAAVWCVTPVTALVMSFIVE